MSGKAGLKKDDNNIKVPLNRFGQPAKQGGRPKGSKNKVISNYNPETMTKSTTNNRPATPLNIWNDTSVQEYFSNLYIEYINLSNRMMDIVTSLNDPVNHPIPKEGYCTKIMEVDFTTELQPFTEDEKRDVPFDNDSYINRFAVFMGKMFKACETGSIGGDACRMENVLCAAAEDIFDETRFIFEGKKRKPLKSDQDRIEHLIGLVIACVRHELHSMLDRGNPERLKLVFGEIAKEFKKFFEPGKNTVVYNVSDEVREFANKWCGALQLMLKSTEKTHGKGAEKYNFNYIRIPRPAQSKALLAKKRKANTLEEHNEDDNASSNTSGDGSEIGNESSVVEKSNDKQQNESVTV